MREKNRRIPKAPGPDAPDGLPQSGRPARPTMSPKVARILAMARALLGGALIVTLSGGVAWAVRRHIVRSARFAVTDLVVTGGRQRAVEALLEEAGLSRGVNVFTVDLDRARARLLADPWISEATLARRLPGTIVVQVTEREVGALVVLRQMYLASRDGVIFKRFDLGDPIDLPVVTGLDPDGVTDDREGAQATIRRALDVASDYERTALGQRAPLEEVHVTTEGGFTLVVGKEALSLALGGPPFRRKLEEAGRVIAELDRRGAKAEAVMMDDEARPERVVVRSR